MNSIEWAVFDVDGTLTEIHSIWEYLLRSVHRWEDCGRPNLEAYLSGRIDYDEFARRDALAFKGISRDLFDALIRDIPRRPGLSDCFRILRERGIRIALLSTGLDILVDTIPDVDFRASNRLVFNDQHICTGDVEVEIPIDGKKAYLDRFLTNRRLSYRNILVVGDGPGDLDIMTAAGLAVAVNPSNENVSKAADFIIPGDDLRDIPRLLFES